MPIYEYYCPDCEIEFEKLVRMSEANVLPECPECGGRHAQKKLSTFATRGAISQGATVSGCGGSGRFS